MAEGLDKKGGEAKKAGDEGQREKAKAEDKKPPTGPTTRKPQADDKAEGRRRRQGQGRRQSPRPTTRSPTARRQGEDAREGELKREPARAPFPPRSSVGSEVGRWKPVLDRFHSLEEPVGQSIRPRPRNRRPIGMAIEHQGPRLRGQGRAAWRPVPPRSVRRQRRGLSSEPTSLNPVYADFAAFTSGCRPIVRADSAIMICGIRRGIHRRARALPAVRSRAHGRGVDPSGGCEMSRQAPVSPGWRSVLAHGITVLVTLILVAVLFGDRLGLRSPPPAQIRGRSGRARSPRPAAGPAPVPRGAGRPRRRSPGSRPRGRPPPEDVLKDLDPDERNNIQVYAAVNKSVVNITTEATELGLLRRRHVHRQRLGIRHRQGRPYPHQFPRRRGGRCRPGHAVRRLAAPRPGHRRRRRQRRGRPADPRAGREAGAGHVRRFLAGDGRPEDPGPGQPLRPGADAHLGDRQQPGALAQGAERPDDQGDHPDGRRDQPRQLGRPAAELARRGDRHEHGDRQPRRPVGGHQLRRADQRHPAHPRPAHPQRPGHPRRPGDPPLPRHRQGPARRLAGRRAGRPSGPASRASRSGSSRSRRASSAAPSTPTPPTSSSPSTTSGSAPSRSSSPRSRSTSPARSSASPSSATASRWTSPSSSGSPEGSSIPGFESGFRCRDADRGCDECGFRPPRCVPEPAQTASAWRCGPRTGWVDAVVAFASGWALAGRICGVDGSGRGWVRPGGCVVSDA